MLTNFFTDDEDFLEGADAIVSGWGSTIEKGYPSNIPMKVSKVIMKLSLKKHLFNVKGPSVCMCALTNTVLF